MYKPASLRRFLTHASPELSASPDKLRVDIGTGSVVSTLAPGLSYAYRYTLTLTISDFSGEADEIIAPLVAWMRVNQPEAFANQRLRESAIRFQADISGDSQAAWRIDIALSERAICTPREDGGYDLSFPAEPAPEGMLDGGHWQLYLNDKLLAEWDSPPA